MEDNKSPADIPSNYVTLLELQERWIKEQQQKLKKKEDEEEKDKQKQQQQNEEEEKKPNPQALKLKDGQTNRRNSNRKYWPKNPDFKQRGFKDLAKENGAEVVAHVVVQENLNENRSESTDKETKSKGLRNKRKRKQRRNIKEEIKMMEDGEARARGGEEETTALPVKREGNVPARRYEVRRDRRFEFRHLATSVVQKSDWTVKIKEEVENVVEKSEGTSVNIKGKYKNVVGETEGTVEIERKLGNLSLQEEKGISQTLNRFVNRSNSQYRGYNRIFNGRNGEYRIYNRGGKPRNGQDRGSYGRFRGSYRRFSRYTGREVWVKKEEVADDGEGAGDQSCSNSVKELE